MAGSSPARTTWLASLDWLRSNFAALMLKLSDKNQFLNDGPYVS